MLEAIVLFEIFLPSAPRGSQLLASRRNDFPLTPIISFSSFATTFHCYPNNTCHCFFFFFFFFFLGGGGGGAFKFGK